MLVRAFFRYRIHIVALAGLLVMLPFRHSLIGVNADVLNAALAMACLTAAGILTNKVADTVEDTLNPKCLVLPPANIRRALMVAGVLCVLPIILIATHVTLLLAYLGLAALIYVFNYGIGGFRLKNILIVKNLSVAIIWTGITCLPYVLLAPDFNSKFFTLSASTSFLLMLCLDIFSDIRDINGDAQAGVKTIANTLGLNAAKGLSLLAMIACVAWNAMLIPLPIVQWIAYIPAAAVVLMASPKRPYFYFQSLSFFWLVPAIIDLIA